MGGQLGPRGDGYAAKERVRASEAAPDRELHYVKEACRSKAVHRDVGELRAPARRAPAAREPGEHNDHEKGTECSYARGQAAAEGLGNPAFRRDDLVDGAADSEQH